MSRHVTWHLVDYLERPLSHEDIEKIESHLRACPDCAGELQWIDAFRKAAIAQGLRHPDPERVIDLADGGGEPMAPYERAHFRICGRCRSELEWARVRGRGRFRYSTILLLIVVGVATGFLSRRFRPPRS